MATDLHVRVCRNPYRGYEVRFHWNGMLNRYSFELRTELACQLVDDSVEQDVIDEVMDSLDATEWGEQPVYPLGVVYVGEAVGDSPVDEPCDCDACTQGHNALMISRQMSDLRSTVRLQWWFVAVALIVIGLVAWFV